MEQVATLESIVPTAYHEQLDHVSELDGKPWRANIATRVHNDALRFAQTTATAVDADPEALIDWLCKIADAMYAGHLQTLNQWDEASLATVVGEQLTTVSDQAQHAAWLVSFIETVQADSSMTKKRMTTLIDAVNAATTVAVPAAKTAVTTPAATLAGRHIGGKRARKLLKHFNH